VLASDAALGVRFDWMLHVGASYLRRSRNRVIK